MSKLLSLKYLLITKKNKPGTLAIKFNKLNFVGFICGFPGVWYQRWSPRGRPWPRGRPRGHILKSFALASKVKSLALASRPQVLENWPVLGSRTALFFELLKFCDFVKHLKNFLENVFLLKTFVKTFFFLFGEHLRLCPWPWPRAFLSLTSRVSVLGKAVLGLGFFLCPWPWPQALCPRLHLCVIPPNYVQVFVC